MDRLTVDPSYGRLLGFLATTYEMQSEFFETDFLPTLLGLGAWDDRSWTSRIALEKHLAELEAATVMQDARPYRGRPRSLHVELTPVLLGVHRALHAKVLIGVYDEAVRLDRISHHRVDGDVRRLSAISPVNRPPRDNCRAMAKRPVQILN